MTIYLQNHLFLTFVGVVLFAFVVAFAISVKWPRSDFAPYGGAIAAVYAFIPTAEDHWDFC